MAEMTSPGGVLSLGVLQDFTLVHLLIFQNRQGDHLLRVMNEHASHFPVGKDGRAELFRSGMVIGRPDWPYMFFLLKIPYPPYSYP